MILENYQTIGGVHHETASVKNILANHSVVSPQTGQPFSEAMLLGIGGGLGTTYILWEFEKHGYPSLVLAFTYKANYPVQYLQTLCRRLGAETQVFETGGKKKAATQLDEALEAGKPAIAWIDLGGPPYYRHFNELGVAVVYGVEDGHYWLDNLARKPFIVQNDLLVEARSRVPSFKNRLMLVEPGRPIELEASIRAGLQDCVEYLGGTSASFALPALRKWTRLVTDTKNDKGWPTVFNGGRGLYGSLRTVYESIALISGGDLRGLYADFLEEAAQMDPFTSLAPVAEYYRGLHARWQDLAQAALPDRVEAFKDTKEMLNKRAAILLEQGSAGLEPVAPISDDLHDLKGELNPQFPLGEAETNQLLEELQSHLQQIYTAEKAAVAALEDATNALS